MEGGNEGHAGTTAAAAKLMNKVVENNIVTIVQKMMCLLLYVDLFRNPRCLYRIWVSSISL